MRMTPEDTIAAVTPARLKLLILTCFPTTTLPFLDIQIYRRFERVSALI